MTRRTARRPGSALLMLLALLAAGGTPVQAAPEPTPKPAPELPALPDGQRDFDFLIGKWKYHLKRLENPLTGSKSWIEFDGTGVCRPIWNGNAQIDELDVNGPSGHVQGLTLRLYNPQSRQWNLNWANAKDATLGVPTIGVLQERPRRVLRPGDLPGPDDPGALRMDQDHDGFAALRAVVLRRRRQDLGGQLDHGPGEGEGLTS